MILNILPLFFKTFNKSVLFTLITVLFVFLSLSTITFPNKSSFLLELDNLITNNLNRNISDKNFIAVYLPCPICPSIKVVQLRDNPK